MFKIISKLENIQTIKVFSLKQFQYMAKAKFIIKIYIMKENLEC
jgi:hypothetical protein